jgi:hypothetical protein
MKKTPFILLTLLLAGAAVHGAVTQRFHVFGVDAARTQRVHDLILAHADCMQTPIENEVSTLERSHATSRKYVSSNMKFAASTSIVSGVPGAVATHTPDVCYTASGYTMKGAPQRKTITLPNGRGATYLAADFEKTKATTVERVRVRWTWFAHGEWSAPDLARFKFMSAPELYKLYVVTMLPTDETPGEDAPAVAGFVAAALAQYAEAIAQ